jgi:phosphonate transport system permease protein
MKMLADPSQSTPQKPTALTLRWHERLGLGQLVFLIFLVLVVLSATQLQGPGRSVDFLGNLSRFVARMWPPDFSVLPEVLQSLRETAQIALLATAGAIVLAVPLALAGARNFSPRWLVVLVRLLLNGIRTLPSLIWAVLAVAIVGPNALAGVLALTFYSLGYLGKFFGDALEASDIEIARSLCATGAHPLQAFQYGIWPGLQPLFWSHVLWLIEYNLRSAAIIGYVGAGGIGLQLHIFQEYGQWPQFATVLLVLLVLVTALDFLGERLRFSLGRKLHLTGVQSAK